MDKASMAFQAYPGASTTSLAHPPQSWWEANCACAHQPSEQAVRRLCYQGRDAPVLDSVRGDVRATGKGFAKARVCSPVYKPLIRALSRRSREVSLVTL